MNELITKEKLEKTDFENVDFRLYKYDVFNVRLNEDPENPSIWIDEKLEGGNIVFPGAYTMKDLKDLMFFYYGEKEYTERFGHLPGGIVE